MNDARASAQAVTFGIPGVQRLGIHFGLPFEDYLADPGIGSNDGKRLATNPFDYWYSSWMNLNRPVEKLDTEALIDGRAYHAHVLEGAEVFDKIYGRGPDHGPDMSPAEKAQATKTARALLARHGRIMIKAPVYDRIRIAAQMIAKNPALEGALEGGQSEVCIFWERHGMRWKARIDKLKARGIGDLKTITNTMDLPFKQACRNAIASFRYDVQAAQYLEGRSYFEAFVNEGAIYHHAGPVDPDWIAAVAAEKRYGFQFIFLQKTDAPVTWSCKLSPGNPMLQEADLMRQAAIHNYKEYMRRFGTDMWPFIEDVEELDISEMPAYYGRR